MDAIYLVYSTTPMFGRFCVPDAINDTLKQYTASIQGYIAKLD